MSDISEICCETKIVLNALDIYGYFPFPLYSHSKTFKVHYSVYFDFNIRKNNKHMLLLCKVRSSIVEGKAIEVHIFLVV